MMFIGVILLAVALAIFAWAVTRRLFTTISSSEEVGDRGGTLLYKVSAVVGQVAVHLLPGSVRKKVSGWNVLIYRAGYSPPWRSEDLVGAQLLCTGFGVFLLSSAEIVNGWGRVAVIPILFFIPILVLNNRRTERQMELYRQFPTALDVITLCMESGVDFTSALREMVNFLKKGPLVREFELVLNEISSGISRAQAIRNMTSRIDPQEVKMALLSLAQAIELGSEVAPILRGLSGQIRTIRFLKAEEQAQKASAKMTFPLMFLIVPCVFLVVLAPIVISLSRTFRQF